MKAKVSSKYQVVIPREIRTSLQLKPGDWIEFFELDSRVEMIPVKGIKEMRGFLSGMDPTLDREDDRF